MDRDNVSVMSKVTATLGRNFIRSKEFQEAQLIGMDSVSSIYDVVLQLVRFLLDFRKNLIN